MNTGQKQIIITEDIVEEAQDVLKEALRAKKRVRKGDGKYEDVPDNKARIEAATLIFAYKFGRPVSRNENLNRTVPAKPGEGQGDVPAEVVRRMVAGGVDVNQMLKEVEMEESGGSLKDMGEVVDI